MVKLRIVRIFLVFVFITLYAICYTLYATYAQDKIIAVVNNDVVTQKDLDDFINFMSMQMSAEYKGKELEERIESMKPDLLNKLIEDRIILQEAKNNKIKIDENKVRARINEIKSHYPSESDFHSELNQQGLSQADLETRISEQLLTYSIIDLKVRSKIVVRPSEVTDFYQENTKEFILPQQREFVSMAIESQDLANEIYNKLKEGFQIEDLSKRYSLSATKVRAIKGWQLKSEIENTVFSLSIGEISMPVKIEDRFYIFRLDKIIPPRQQSLPEVQDKIYSFLFNRKMQEKLTNWLDELKGKSYIKIFQD